MEEKDGQEDATFDINFGVNILACSLPFSTILIIGIFSFSEFFADPITILSIGAGVLTFSFIPQLLKLLNNSKDEKKIPLSKEMNIVDEETQKIEQNLKQVKSS